MSDTDDLYYAMVGRLIEHRNFLNDRCGFFAPGNGYDDPDRSRDFARRRDGVDAALKLMARVKGAHTRRLNTARRKAGAR